jgi:formate hydrogenlyase transcriptional activator
MNKVIDEIRPETMDAMVAYDWPGNIRQLQNFVEHGVILSPGPVFQPHLNQLQPRRETKVLPSTRRTLEDATRDHILQTLEETKWIVGGRQGAAARLGVARTTLLSKMRRLGIESTAAEMLMRSGQKAFGAVA